MIQGGMIVYMYRVYSRQGDWGIPPIFKRSPSPNLKKEGRYFYLDKEEKILKFM